MRRRPHSYSSARARFPALKKSRSLTESSREQRFLGARGRTRFQAEAGSAKPAVACPRRVSAARTPTTVPSSAARGRGRPAAAGRARPSSATGASGAERTSSSLYRLLFFTASAAASGGEKLCESSLRDPAATCPLSSLPGNFSPLQLVSGLPRADSGRSPSCQQRPRSGALRLGAAGEGDLPALPKTPAREPQALAPGRGRENGKENKICSPPQLTVPVCLPESANLHSRLAASATLSATLSPYPAHVFRGQRERPAAPGGAAQAGGQRGEDQGLSGSCRASAILHAKCLQGCPAGRYSNWKQPLPGAQILCFTLMTVGKKFTEECFQAQSGE